MVIVQIRNCIRAIEKFRGSACHPWLAGFFFFLVCHSLGGGVSEHWCNYKSCNINFCLYMGKMTEIMIKTSSPAPPSITYFDGMGFFPLADDVRKRGRQQSQENPPIVGKLTIITQEIRPLPFISKWKHSRSKKQGFTLVAEIFMPGDNLDCRYLDCTLSGGNSLQTFFFLSVLDKGL